MTEPIQDEGVPMPKPAVREVYATAQNTPSVKAGFEMGGYVKSPDLYTAEQLRAYGDQCANAALEQAAKACSGVEEPPWYSFECPYTFQSGVSACADAIRALKKDAP